MGRDTIAVISRPTVAIISTGNELVSCEQAPGPGKIRNSNEPMLRACITELGYRSVGLGVARDEGLDVEWVLETHAHADHLSAGPVVKAATGAKVALSPRVDPALLGGMIVRVGSRMVDSSLRTKLSKLELAMKGIG